MSSIRLDVNIFDSQDEKSKKTNCVPLKNFDIIGKKLSDVRSALIDNGGLDAGKVGCSFCSSAGALVNDATLFSDYLEILSEGEKEKTSKSVHNVYIYVKTKKSSGISEETKELVKKELNLKLSDKPELLKTSLDQLVSSFDRADWAAQASETSTNPAEMSEKEWNAVIRNNSLTSASRMVFSNLGFASDGKQKVKFRRIERAPYSAFVLKPRKFQPHEIGDADVKVAQQFYIPRFVVTDDSYVDMFETKSSVATAMARSSFSSIEAEASVEGGAFGYSAAVSAGFSQSESNALSKQSTSDSSSMNITYNFPRVVMHLDQHSLAISDECREDLAKVDDEKKLVAFHHKYGHFFATRVELGGRLFSSEKFSTLGVSSASEASKAMKVSASVSFSSKYVGGGASSAYENSEAKSDSNTTRSMQNSINWQAQGGDTLLCNNPPEWCPTVAPSQNWRVIKQEDVIPLGDLLGLMPGFDDIPARFNRLAEVTRKKETVSFRLCLEEYQRKDQEKKTPEYFCLHHAAQLKREITQMMAIDNPSLSTTGWNDGAQSSVIQEIYDNGYFGVSFEAAGTEGVENVFDVEVETLLGQPASIELCKPYHLYNRKKGQWLRTVTITRKGREIPLLAGGPKHEATLFEFRQGGSSGALSNGDKCSLLAYGKDGRQKGFIAQVLRSPLGIEGTDHKSIGALTYSTTNETWIRFCTLEMVNERDVPK